MLVFFDVRKSYNIRMKERHDLILVVAFYDGVFRIASAVQRLLDSPCPRVQGVLLRDCKELFTLCLYDKQQSHQHISSLARIRFIYGYKNKDF